MHETTRLQEIARTVLDPENRERFDFANGFLYRSYGRLLAPANTERFIARLARILEPVWERRCELRFLDVGCGFGFAVAALAVCGARAAQGVEAAPECLKTCDAMRAAFPDLPVQFFGGRAEALPVADHSADVVISIEALSHFIEPWQFLSEAWRVLAPGGMLIVVDDNNKANWWQRRELEEVWDRFENGPPTDNIHGHRVLLPYVARRRQILQSAFPQATEEEVTRLSQLTSGLWGEELLAAAQRYFTTGDLPQSPYRRGVCPVEPTSGAFIENLLDPREIGTFLRQQGAEVEVRPYFGGESRGGTVRLLDTFIRKTLPAAWSLRVAAGFRVYARKAL